VILVLSLDEGAAMKMLLCSPHIFSSRRSTTAAAAVAMCGMRENRRGGVFVGHLIFLGHFV
jgi:hypothetical protein